MVAQAGSTVTGTVSNVNAKGIQLDGAQWHNISNYAKNVTLPQKGQQVSLKLDGQGYVREVTVTGTPIGQVFSAASGGGGNRDRSIVLQTVMKAASHVAAAGMPFDETADAMLEWYESRIGMPSNNQNGVGSEELEDLPF